jgi:putative ABC transport system ATP-binding protein
MPILLEARNVYLNYKDGKNSFKVIKNLNLSIPSTGFYGILGPSGSGKTSMLYLLSGMLEPSGGDILYNGYKLPKSKTARQALRRSEMGFVFQFHFLINYLSVYQNILIGSDPKDIYRYDVAKMLIKRLELDGLENRKPYELSGGQRQRVAIARSLANRPKVLFVDEPTASLDHKIGQKVIDMLYEFSQEACVILVTHDPTVLTKATQIYQMWDGKLIPDLDTQGNLWSLKPDTVNSLSPSNINQGLAVPKLAKI